MYKIFHRDLVLADFKMEASKLCTIKNKYNLISLLSRGKVDKIAMPPRQPAHVQNLWRYTHDVVFMEVFVKHVCFMDGSMSAVSNATRRPSRIGWKTLVGR